MVNYNNNALVFLCIAVHLLGMVDSSRVSL